MIAFYPLFDFPLLDCMDTQEVSTFLSLNEMQSFDVCSLFMQHFIYKKTYNSITDRINQCTLKFGKG